ncbi:AbrB family transcriptional regulator [Cereibacter changlensis]|uniref:AbrB family transcriptional regulator n=1 Tax=Cereibacter changlensis TaxID=402884 RepID=A0A4U0YWR9_9RHOB|nr:AbrB family transcriptional regulator [Cereibacter changlensis]TKA96198.1 AbrB family transcriptional regulator [Cereibacter changlensis]
MTDGPASSGAALRRFLRLALFIGLGACGGWLFQRIGSPLPWMIGPLVVTALLCLTGALPTQVPNRLRPFGQVVVASQVGLTFTSETLHVVLELGPVILGTAMMTLVCILLVTLAFSRWSGMTLAQGFLANVPTSPVEAAAMAVENRVDPVPVIFSQTLRLSAVVLVLPFGLFALEGWPAGRGMPYTDVPIQPLNIVLLLACGFAAMHLFRWLRIPNPNFLGPLAATATLAVSGYGLPPYPAVILSAAQVVLGCWLGSTFRRELVARAGRLTLTCLVSILTLLAACSLGAAGIAQLAGMDWRLLVLGAAPGGVTEMALTAKFLGQNATIVTAFHLTRIFIFMPNIPWIVAVIARYERRRLRPESEDK